MPPFELFILFAIAVSQPDVENECNCPGHKLKRLLESGHQLPEDLTPDEREMAQGWKDLGVTVIFI